MKRIFLGARCALFLTITSSFFSTSAYAINEWFESYNNTRSLGMGGASIAITSDETSLYRNPANLGSIRDVYGTILDPELEASTNFTNQVTAKSLGKAFDIPEIINVLTPNPESFYHAKTQLTPSLTMRNFGIGLIYRNEVSAQMDATATNLDVKYQYDVGAIIGGTLRLFDGRIKIGASAKLLNRIEVNNSALPVSGPTDLSTIGSEGTALAYDGGLLIQLPWTFIPTLGAVVRDIGDTKFDKRDGLRMSANSRPATVPQSVDVALGLFPIHGNQLRSVWTLEYSDVANSRNDTDNAKRIHFGTELNVRDLFFFRAGYNQRYWTAGFEFASEKFQWQVSSYGEEVGTETSPKEDRRYTTKISLRF